MWPFLFSSVLWRVTILGVSNQTNMHFKHSISNITVWKMSFLTKSMLLINFVIDFIPVSCTAFEIKKVTPNLIARWRYNRFPWIALGNFTIPRPNFYDYSSCRSEIIGVATDFSGHSVYTCIYMYAVIHAHICIHK